jgi:hypothetical protein
MWHQTLDSQRTEYSFSEEEDESDDVKRKNRECTSRGAGRARLRDGVISRSIRRVCGGLADGCLRDRREVLLGFLPLRIGVTSNA